MAVVDPGVGTDRRPIAPAHRARRRPGRAGQRAAAARRADGSAASIAARLLENRAWFLPATSATFHGRDVFAPVAAHLAIGEPFADVGPAIEPATLVPPRPAVGDRRDRPARRPASPTSIHSATCDWPGGAADLADALGPMEPGAELALDLGANAREEHATWRRTFGEAAPGDLLVYEDSSGDLAIAVSSGNAARRLGVRTGARIGIRRA